MKMVALVLLVGLVAGACEALSTGSGTAADVRVHVAGATFQLDPTLGTARVAMVVRNAGEETVYLARCGDELATVLERRQGDEWVEAGAAVCPAVYNMAPAPLTGSAVRETARAVAAPGTYRLRVGISESVRGPFRWAAVSGPFVVE